MHTNDDFAAKYERHHEQLQKATLANKATVFEALHAAKITSVQVDFDGESDSGQINHITAYHNETAMELPSTPLTLQQVRFGMSGSSRVSEPLPDAIEALCYAYLEQEHSGWEIDEGAYGTFSFDVATRSIELEFKERFINIETSYHAL
jgi:hypothetical protein